MSAVLTRCEIQGLLEQEPPLIEGFIDPDEQLQPNGVDLTLREISIFQSPGKVAASNSQRVGIDLQWLVQASVAR